MNGSIWAGIWYQYLIALSEPGKAIAYMLAAATLVAIIFIDWELYIIPDQINAFLMVVGFGFNAYLYSVGSPLATTWGIPSSIAGALTGILILWGITFIGRVIFQKDAMGHGDIKMARGIGAVLFPMMAVVSFGLAVTLGAVLGVAQILAFRGKGEPEGQEEEGEFLPPESYGSLFKSLVGYLLLFDVIGLFFPKFYISYFGEDPFEPVGDDDGFEVERTMIPFGPYLALGAIVGTIFETQLRGSWDAYVHWATGSQALLELITGWISL
jgi:leader peptidase (prepilin peptidase)/N-methyltransferase